MKQTGRILILLSVAVFQVLPALGGKEPHVEGGRLEFRLPDLEGRPIASEDLRGKVLLVDLWGTWCPPCLTTIPTLVELQERYGGEGLEIVSIAFEREDDPSRRRARLRSFVQEHGISYLVLDGGPVEEFAQALPMMKNVKGFPIEIIIDRDGAVVEARNGYGYKKRWARKLERELVELLRGPSD